MDAAGAESLRWSIEQQQHWCQAEAVRDGRQAHTDPDLEQLESIDGDVRLYFSRVTRDGIQRLCKRLVDGFWEHGLLDEHLADAPVETGVIAHVA